MFNSFSAGLNSFSTGAQPLSAFRSAASASSATPPSLNKKPPLPEPRTAPARSNLSVSSGAAAWPAYSSSDDFTDLAMYLSDTCRARSSGLSASFSAGDHPELDASRTPSFFQRLFSPLNGTSRFAPDQEAAR